MRYLAAFTVVLIIAPSGVAQAANAEGAGVRSCGEFAKDYQQSPREAEALYFSWTEGFLSGVNAGFRALSQPIRDLSGTPLDAQKAFIRAYCDGHPLAQYSDAVMELYSKFPPLLDKAAR